MTEKITTDGARDVPSRRSQALWLLAGVPAALLVFGLVSDLLLGLPLAQRARFPLGWIIGVVALGALYVLGEWSGEWIHARDSVGHPLWKRLAHLAALLLTGALLLASMWFLVLLAT